MPLDLSFSAWLFYLFYKAELVITAASGWGVSESRFPYPQDQAFGAYLAIFLFVAWGSRRTLLRALVTGLGGRTKAAATVAEPVSTRHAFWMVVLGSLFLVAFARAAGMELRLALIFFALYFGLAVLASRIRAELGFPVIDMVSMELPQALVRMFGSEAFGPRNLAVLGLFHWFNRAYRSHPMPHMLEGFKLAERAESPARAFYVAIVVALLVAVPASFWAYLDMYYRRGAGTGKVEMWALGFGRGGYDALASWIRTPTPRDSAALLAVGAGASIAALLALARMRFFWFPLHPLAYAVANGWGMHNLWSCVFVGWLAKAVVLHYGGLRRYRELIPFFLGIMLGEFFVGSLWTLIGIALDIRTYDFWP
jgi:hypothetical protein